MPVDAHPARVDERVLAGELLDDADLVEEPEQQRVGGSSGSATAGWFLALVTAGKGEMLMGFRPRSAFLTVWWVFLMLSSLLGTKSPPGDLTKMVKSEPVTASS